MKKEARRKKLHIYLFRHGQTDFNRDKRFTGWLESRLTPLGKKQAETIAKKLKNKKFEVAFYTHLIRSQETLKPVMHFHPECQKLIKDDRMIERNYGILNGMSHEDFIRKIGHNEYDLLRHGDAIENLSPKDRKRVEKVLGEEEFKLIHRGYDTPPPKGESFAMVEKRVRSFIKFLIPYMKKNKVNVAISAHGNSIRLFRKIWEKKSKEQAVKWFIPYDKVFVYTINV